MSFAHSISLATICYQLLLCALCSKIISVVLQRGLGSSHLQLIERCILCFFHAFFQRLVVLKEEADNGVALNLLVHHKSKNSHHSSTAVVQFNSTLAKLGLLIECVPAEVKSTVTEVTRELSSSGNILHDEELKKTDEKNNLSESLLWDGLRAEKGGGTIGVRVEGVSGEVDVSGKVDSGAGYDLAKEGKLGNTSVLELNVTKTVETGLVGIVEEAKRILFKKDVAAV